MSKFSFNLAFETSVMVKRFSNYLWNVRDGNTRETKLRNVPCVYAIAVICEHFKDMRVTYIGVTKSLQSRMKGNYALRKLRKNRNGFNILILYKDFGQSNVGNNWMERILIRKHNPPFNGHYQKGKKYTRFDLWEDLKIKKVI